MISYLLFTSIVIPTSSKGKESDELSCTIRSLVMVRNQLPAQVVERTSRTFLPQNCNVSSVLSLFKYNTVTRQNG